MDVDQGLRKTLAELLKGESELVHLIEAIKKGECSFYSIENYMDDLNIVRELIEILRTEIDNP